MRNAWSKSALVAISLAALVACTESPGGPSNGVSKTRQYAPAQAAAVSDFTRLLGLSLREANVRQAIHTALRLSPNYEHKVLLDEFLRSEAGSTVLAGIASASGRTISDLRSLVAGLPRLHFYVHIVEDRRSWLAESPVAVAAWIGDSIPLYAYTAAGDSFFVDRRSPNPVRPMALLFLGPDEPIAVRRSYGRVSMLLSSDDRFIESPSEEMNQECYPIEECEGGGGGGGGGVDGDTMWLDTLQTSYLCDNDNCAEGNELEIWAALPGGGSGQTLFCYGMPSVATRKANTFCYNNENKLHSTSPNETDSIYVDSKEIDTSPNPDDSLEEEISPYRNWLNVVDNPQGRHSRGMCDHDGSGCSGVLTLTIKWHPFN